MTIEYHRVMADLETLGTRPGDIILSFGAVLFRPDGTEVSSLYLTIDKDSSKAAGLRAQRSTLEWWAKQSPEAQQAAFRGEFTLDEALTRITAWLPPPNNLLMYGNGANFDNALLAAAYRAAGREVPWKYWNDRCFRTISAMFLNQQCTTPRVGTYHNALDDARTQMQRLCKMAEHHGFELK